jgi:hypothetical protein
MHTYDMLHVLQQVEERLPSMLAHPFTEWQALSLNERAPRLERVWTRVEQFRVCLDRLHPSEKVAMQRPAWPSAVHVVSGRCEVRVGASETMILSTSLLNESSRSEIPHKDGWHSMRALGAPSMMVTVAGPSWETGVLEAELSASKLTEAARDSIVGWFRERYRGLR